MNNPHKQFPGKMDNLKKKTYKRGYKIATQGNVKEGYSKLKHVKLFESFDQEEKWFVAKDEDGCFKFQANDIDEAKEIAAKEWQAKLVGEATNDMDFEDEPMEVNEEITPTEEHLKSAEEKWNNANTDGRKDQLKIAIPSMSDKYVELDWDDLTPYIQEELAVQVLMDEVGNNESNDVNEGSYTDFLTSYVNDIRSAVKKMQDVTKVYDDKVEGLGDKIDKVLEPYDENVGGALDSWTDGNVSADKVAKFAVENQDKYGTEPQMVLDAIDAYYNVFKK